MGDIWDEIAAQSVGGSTAAAPDMFDEIAANAVATNAPGAVSGMLGKGAAAGWFDELQAYDYALQQNVRNIFDVFGLGNGNNGKTFDENYNDLLGAARARDEGYEKANPGKAALLQIGGAAIPAALSGGAGLLAKEGLAVAANPVASVGQTIGKTLYGKGVTAAPTIKQLIGMGATGGAVYGAGNATEGNRTEGAVLGGATGALVAPFVGKGLEYATRGVGNLLARYQLLPDLMPERGSFSSKLSTRESYTPGELMLASKLKNTPLGQVTAASDEMRQAVANNTPLFLPEALDDAGVIRNAQFIANYEPSMGPSKLAINTRADEAGARIKNLMGEFSPEVSAADAGTDLMSVSGKAVGALKDVRRDATKPIYDMLKGQQIPDEMVDSLVGDPVIEAAINAVGKNPAYQKALAGADPTSFQYLQLTKQHLDDQVNSLARAGSNNEARIVGESRDTVTKALESLDQFQGVNSTYRDLSKPINRLEGTKDEAGLLQGILGKDQIKAHQAPAELLKLTPAQIVEVRESLGTEGAAAFKKSARALMQDVMGQANERNQPALLLLKNEDTQSKFRALLGDADYEKFAASLGLEKRMAQGRNAYTAGSPTFGLGNEQVAFEKGVDSLTNVAKGNWFAAVSKLFDGGMPEEVAQELSKIYFDPKSGSRSIEKIIPLLKRYGQVRTASGAVSKGAAVGSKTRASIFAPREERAMAEAPAPSQQFDLFDEQAAGAPANVLSLGDEAMTASEVVAAPQFSDRVNEIADNLEVDPKHLMAVMKFETGGAMTSDVKNKAGSGATGLIQFTPSTAQSLTGADTKAAAIKLLSDMTPTEQLSYVEKYLEPFKGKLNTLEDVYMAVLYPKAVGKDPDYALFEKGTKAYWQNRGLDIDQDGTITKSEAASKVKGYA